MSISNVIQDVSQLGLGDAKGARPVAADMFKGTQLGAGLRPANIDAASPATFTPTVFVVLQTPTMYDKQYPAFGRMIKQLVESHATSITGVDFGYNLETDSKLIGNDGQSIKVPTKAKRTEVAPSMVFPEITGNLVWELFRQWLVDIQDPDTNISMARFQKDGQEGFTDLGPYMSSLYSMSMIGIQFDPTGLPDRIIDAAFYSNMFPTDPGGQFGFERNIGQVVTKDRTVNFTGHVQHNDATRALGIEIAKKLKLNLLRYNNVKPGVTDVAQHLTQSGLADELNVLLNNAEPTSVNPPA